MDDDQTKSLQDIGGSGVGVLNFVPAEDPAPAASDSGTAEDQPEPTVFETPPAPEPPAPESDPEQNAHDPAGAPDPAMNPGTGTVPSDEPEPYEDPGGESGSRDDLGGETDDPAGETKDPDSGIKQEGEEYTNPAENKMRVILKALKSIEENISNVIKLLEEEGVSAAPLMKIDQGDPARPKHDPGDPSQDSPGGRVVEGVFNGQHTVGSDGKIYSVPPNYASKSKLVEGDMMKLTISSTGSFIYKQIGPIERKRVVAVLGFDPTTGEYYATEGNKRWNIIKASVTYFKGEPGDETVLLIPKEEPSKWAAVENIIRKSETGQRTEE